MGDFLELNANRLKSGLLAFFSCFAIVQLTGITVRNPLTVVFFVFSYWMALNIGKVSVFETLVSVASSGVVTAITYRRAVSAFNSGLFKILSVAIILVGSFCIFYIFLGIIDKLRKKEKFFTNRLMLLGYEDKEPFTGRKTFFIVALICLLCWIPYYLYEFPGIMTADSLVQYGQIIGVEPLSNHHPYIHTLLIKLFYSIGYALTDSPIIGIACFTLFQMVFMAFCCANLVCHLSGRRMQILAVVFYALVPFNSVFMVTVWKDVIFAGIASILICHIIDMRKSEENSSILSWAIFTLLAALFSLLRSNAWYAFILWIPFTLIVFKRELKRAFLSVITVIVFVVVIKGPIMSSAGIAAPDFVESLSVPAQQIARVLVDEKKISAEDYELVQKVIDTTYIKELYAPDFADNIKELIRAGHPEVLEANKAEYFSLWLRVCINNPGTVIRAWYDLVGGYIYPDVAYNVGDFDGIMGNELGLYSSPLFGGKAFIKFKEISIKMGSFVPIYGMFWSVGTYTWLLVISMLVCAFRREHLLCKTLLLFMIATLLIAAPVVDFRYGYAIVLTMPLWVFYNRRKE